MQQPLVSKCFSFPVYPVCEIHSTTALGLPRDQSPKTVGLQLIYSNADCFKFWQKKSTFCTLNFNLIQTFYFNPLEY